MLAFGSHTALQSLSNLLYNGQLLDRAWTATGQTMYVAFHWTDIGQRLDNVWAKVGFCVKLLSDQSLATSTVLPLWVGAGRHAPPRPTTVS